MKEQGFYSALFLFKLNGYITFKLLFQMSFKSLYILFALCLFANSTIAAQEWLSKGLLAYYPLDGNANDGRNERNDGTIIKVKATTDRFDHPEKAIEVIGGSVEIYNVNIPKEKTTITLWVKPNITTDSGKKNILSKHFSYANCELLIRLRPDGYYSAEWNIGATYFDLSKEEGAELFKPSFTKYDFIVLRYDGNKAELFVNNKLSARKFIKGDIVNNNKALYLGSLSGFPKREAFSGSIDELRIYNRALSNSEISQLFNLKN